MLNGGKFVEGDILLPGGIEYSDAGAEYRRVLDGISLRLVSKRSSPSIRILGGSFESVNCFQRFPISMPPL